MPVAIQTSVQTHLFWGKSPICNIGCHCHNNVHFGNYACLFHTAIVCQQVAGLGSGVGQKE